MMDSLAKDQLMDALQGDNPDLRWKIFQTRTKSLDEALEIAIECEAFQTAEMQRPNFHNHVRNIETGHGTVLPVLQEVLEVLRSLQSDQKSPPKRSGQGHDWSLPKTCYGCGQTGHIQKYCPQMNMTSSQPAPINQSPINLGNQ